YHLRTDHRQPADPSVRLPRHPHSHRDPRAYLHRLTFCFSNGAAPPQTYTLSLHDALPISSRRAPARASRRGAAGRAACLRGRGTDRKSTRLNSSHDQISYAVSCLKKKTYSGESGWG